MPWCAQLLLKPSYGSNPNLNLEGKLLEEVWLPILNETSSDALRRWNRRDLRPPGNIVYIISGPCTSHEIRSQMPTKLCRNLEQFHRLQSKAEVMDIVVEK
ncbi:hypothetical protein CDL15_Pgr010551 [Punica granatum]|uniref:Uncharacterized protein n=1 Tax=Punica granatum TaxID=22663 RepID=A0A218XWC7_PUNGR|nr:hypothetical protein CDL15_Pgr010551 [Punica granatum]